MLNRNRARVDEIFSGKIVFFASFKIKKIDALLLIGLAHAIPLHADGLCILNINTLLLTPGPECRHLLARHVIEVAEVTPHVYAEEIVDAFGECLLGMTVKEVVCFWAFRLGVRYANCNISLSRLLRLVIDWALREEPAQNSILVAAGREFHGITERMGEPLLQVWLYLYINYEFTHISVIKNTAKLGKIIDIILCLQEKLSIFR